MSYSAPSRASATVTLTLADVLTAVSAAQLPERRRQDLASAVRTAARALARSPEQVPADPRRLGERLAEIAPAAVGFSQARWSNVVSLLRQALRLVTPTAPGRHRTQLSPAWQSLWDKLPSMRHYTRLSRFIHFCTAEAIEPAAVTQETFCAYREHLDLALLKSPESVYINAVYGWNRARTSVPVWPDVVVRLPDRRRLWTLPWDRFPISLKTETDQWLDRLGGRDPFEEVPFRPLRLATLWRREYEIRLFASALVLRGGDPASLTRLADLVAIDAFKEGLRFLLERSGGKPTSRIFEVATSLKAIARHQVKVDAEHLAKMASLICRLNPGRRGMTAKNRERLRALDDRGNALALIGLPAKLRELAERDKKPYRAALTMQMAVGIEILLMAPIRVGNLCALDIERHLIRPNRNGSALHVVIDSAEVKNGEPLEYPLPVSSVELLECYLTQFRPTLALLGNTALFPGRSGTKHIGTIRKQLCSTVFRHTGLRVHPHLFRHIGAKLFLDNNPGAYEVVRRVLGHRSIETTTTFYTGLETAAAVRHFDAAILKLREAGAADG